METLQRIRMSYEEYEALPEHSRAEWVDGVVVMSPTSPTRRHQKVTRRMANFLEASLPRTDVIDGLTVCLPNNRERIPDVTVMAEPPAGNFIMVGETPLLVVEVLSPSTRSEDTIRKSAEYFAAGIQQYWVVDPELRTIEVFEHGSDAWLPLLRLDEATPTGSVVVGDHGTVTVELSALLTA